jgi:WD40 repeat protein
MIAFPCHGCGRSLGVSDEFAGRPVRCPACGQVTQAPSRAAPAVEDIPEIMPNSRPHAAAVPPPLPVPEDVAEVVPVRRKPRLKGTRPARGEARPRPARPHEPRVLWPWIIAGAAVLLAAGGGMTAYLAGWLSPAPPAPVAAGPPPADKGAGRVEKAKEAPAPGPGLEVKKDPAPGPDEKAKEGPMNKERPPFDVAPPPVPPPLPRTRIARAADVPAVDAPRWRLAVPQVVTGLAPHPDGKHFVWADVRGVLRLAELEAGRTVREMKGHTGAVFALAVSADGKRALSGGWDRTACVWDLETGNVLTRFTRHTDRVNDVVLSADGKRALSAQREFLKGAGTVWLWDTVTGRDVGTVRGTAASAVLRAHFYPDDRRVLLTRGWSRQRARLTLWDPATGQEEDYFTPQQDRNPEPLGGLALSANGQRLLLRVQRSLLLLRTHGAVPLRQVDVETLTRAGVALSADGRLAACFGGGSRAGQMMDCFVHVFATDTGREVCRLRHAREAFVRAFFTRDGRHILSATRTVVQLWDLPPGP